VGISCPRLPHEGPISPIVAITCIVIVNMVTSPIEPTKMDENECEVFWSIPKEPSRA